MGSGDVMSGTEEPANRSVKQLSAELEQRIPKGPASTSSLGSYSTHPRPPPHKSISTGSIVGLKRAPPPPPIPRHGRERQSNPLPKPKIAPKPANLRSQQPSPTTSSTNGASEHAVAPATWQHRRKPPTPPPKILVSPSFQNGHLHPQFEEGGTSDETIRADDHSNYDRNDKVLMQAKMLDEIGFTPRMNLPPPPPSRPTSDAPTSSLGSADMDGETSGSDDDSGLPIHRKMTTATRHDEIIMEMQSMLLERTKHKGQKSARTSDEIPSDVGRIRPRRTSVARNDTLSPSPNSSKLDSFASDRSSMLSDHSGELDAIVPDYDLENEKENKRLKQLHYLVIEIRDVEEKFVRYLKDMKDLYPVYIEKYLKKVGKELTSQHGQENVVKLMKKEFAQILPAHEFLLNSFNGAVSTWDSRDPNFANLLRCADVLKVCGQFLKKKGDYVKQISQLRLENKDFDDATFLFETEILRMGSKNSLQQQLDQVHQNFMRYKLFMDRYEKLLLPDTQEVKNCKEVIVLLEGIAQRMNKEMGLPSNEELIRLYDRFQCQFEVFKAGRVLIRQSDVRKQTRKESQHRYMVLFNDFLWLCHVHSSSNGANFDMRRSKKIPINEVSVSTKDDADYALHLFITSKTYSATVIFTSERERNAWKEDIERVAREHKRNCRRRSDAITKHEYNRRLTISSEDPINLNHLVRSRPSSLLICTEDSEEKTEGQDADIDDDSQPVTPCEDTVVSFLENNINGNANGMESIVSNQTKKKKKKRNGQELVKPNWLPDSSSSTCLMEGCSTEFGIINRRHHCRDCGWLICNNCKGQAPLAKFHYEKRNVCPECYKKVYDQYTEGDLFPSERLIMGPDGTARRVAIGTKDECNDVDPASLFKQPRNLGLTKRIDRKREEAKVFGKVVKGKRGDQVMYAGIFDDFELRFYKAELDFHPAEKWLIHGFVFRESELDDGGWLFELIHRNQFQADDAKEHKIEFRVELRASALRWSSVLTDVISQENQ